MKTICVFCGSSEGLGDDYLGMAKALGKRLAQEKMRLVYGGASIGVMAAVANSILEDEGEVYGVIPQSLCEAEVAHDGLTQLYVTTGMHERKKKMYDLSDAFVVLPGGFGTLDEFFEILTWGQLGYHSRPIYLYNYNGYFDLLLQFVDQMAQRGFVRSAHLKLFSSVNSLDELFKNFDSSLR